MTRKIFIGAAVFGIAAVALIYLDETTTKDPKPRPTLEWTLTLPDRTFDIKLEAYRMRMAVARAYELFLARASLALASMGTAGLVLRRLRTGFLRRRSHP